MRLMNLMNFNERVLGIRESLCFVGGFWAVLGPGMAILAVFYITNVVAAPKKWFIKVHMVHQRAFLEQYFYKLMNLMNFDELAYYLWLSFAMVKNQGFHPWLPGECPSSLKFIWFIKYGILKSGQG